MNDDIRRLLESNNHINGKVIPVLTYVIKHCHEGIWGNGCIAPPFLISALVGVVSFTPLPLYASG
jgi:hypothetical protein